MELSGDSNSESGSELEWVSPTREKKRRVDVMGNVSITGDRLALSARKRAAFAASCMNAVEVPVSLTNISFTTAWQRARTERLEKAQSIKDNFNDPEFMIVHWDGKIVKVREGKSSERCCVYISGTLPDGTVVQKLLGVPEIPDGTGSSQEFTVSNLLTEWNLTSNIIGVVFDTTASNTGQWRGACALIETFLEKPVLWLACCHHMAERDIKHVVQTATGDTKKPGVKLFKRLKSSWHDLKPNIDYQNLNKFDWNSCGDWLREEAEEVLLWALERHKDKTFPRDDYRELLELLITWLGVYVPLGNMWK